MKTFLRSNATYKAESKQLDDDIELPEFTQTPPSTVCNCQSEIAALNERINDLTKLVNSPKKNDGASKKVKAKAVVKKAAVKKPVKKK